MKQSINLINTKLTNGDFNKSSYHDILASFDEKIQSFLSEQKFESPVVDNLFLQTTDERLSYAKEKEALSPTNPNVVIQEAVKSKLDLLRSFLKRYHIGFIKDAKINSNGMAEIEIACTITTGSLSSKQVSAKQTLDMQMNFLKEQGFTLINEEIFGLSLKSCEENTKLIYNLLESRGAKLVRILADKNRIDSISFFVSYENLKKFECDEIKFELGVSNTLNADEQKNVSHVCKEILETLSSISFLGEGMKDVCCSLIEGYFSELCKTFNYESKTLLIHKARYKDERAKNEKIAHIEKSLTNTLTFEQVKNTLDKVKEYVSEKLLEQTGFVVTELSISNYGSVSISFTGCGCPYFYSVDKDKTKENIDKHFKTIREDHSDGDPFILNVPENIISFEKILLNILPTTRILSIEISNYKNNYCIKKINATVDTLLPVINKATA